MMQDVGNRKVVGKGGVDQGEMPRSDSMKLPDAGSPCGFRQPVGREMAPVPGG